MLTFVIPLKSKKASNSWDHVSRLFERTLKSLCNQTLSDFRVVVVCHERPSIDFRHPNVEYLEVDFERPGQSRKEKGLDKARKTFIGVIRAQELNASYIMPVDADDCVSSKLVEFIHQNPKSNGWYIDKGYVHKEGSKFVYFRHYRFSQSCGTSRIIRSDLFQLGDKSTNIYQVSGEILKDLVNHKSKQIGAGAKLERLPFPGAIYIIGNNENLYLTDFAAFHGSKEGFNRSFFAKIKDLRNYRFLTRTIQGDFSLYPLNKS